MDDRRVLERTHEDLANDVAVIASEFLGGFQRVLEIDRPAVSIFGSARVREDSEPYRQARATAGSSPRPDSRSSPAAARA